MADDVLGLDSRAVLGLLTKARQMFTRDDTTLSFPIGAPLAFNAEQLALAMGPAPDPIGYALLAEFSTAMNLIPSSVIWPPSSARGLDDVIRDVLAEAEWALSDRTPAEEARFNEAQAQIDLHNPEMAEYASLRDAWIRARERLANEPGNPTAEELERSTSIALAAFPARARIERAMQDLIALDERAPHRARERFEREIDTGIGTFDSPTGGEFSPVRLLPRAVVTSTGWDTVTLDRAALDELAASAPPELSERLIVDHASDDPIERISFEYASALLQRPWFDGTMFELQCWRFADDARLLSDGQTPPAGECPRYVHAVVLARNVAVTSRVPAASGGADEGRAIDFLVPRIEDIGTQFVPVPPPPVEEPVDPGRIAGELFTPRRARMRTWALAEPDAAVSASPPVDHHRLRLARLTRSDASDFAEMAAASRTVNFAAVEHTTIATDFSRRLSTEAAASNRHVVDAIRAEAAVAPDFELIRVLPDHVLEPPPDDPETVTRSTPAGTVIVLALICKTVPRTPNPGADAIWS